MMNSDNMIYNATIGAFIPKPPEMNYAEVRKFCSAYADPLPLKHYDAYQKRRMNAKRFKPWQWRGLFV